MLQLATQSTQLPLNSRPVDNQPQAVAQHLRRPHTPQKLFRAAWRSSLPYAISTIDNSAGLIGAG